MCSRASRRCGSRGIEATPGDVADSGGYLSTIDFGKALAAATNNGADPFDVVFFDQCFQGNLDVLYEVRNYAKVLIASPNTRGCRPPITSM